MNNFQERLYKVALLSIRKKILNKTNYDNLINYFV